MSETFIIIWTICGLIAITIYVIDKLRDYNTFKEDIHLTDLIVIPLIFMVWPFILVMLMLAIAMNMEDIVIFKSNKDDTRTE